MVSPLFTLQHAVEKEFFKLGRPRVMTRLSHFDMDDHKRLLHNLSDMLKPEYSVEHLDRNICSTPEITIFLHLDDGGLHGGKLGRPTWPSKGGFHTRVTEVAGSEVIPRYKEVALFHQLLLGDEPPRASLWRRDPKNRGDILVADLAYHVNDAFPSPVESICRVMQGSLETVPDSMGERRSRGRSSGITKDSRLVQNRLDHIGHVCCAMPRPATVSFSSKAREASTPTAPWICRFSKKQQLTPRIGLGFRPLSTALHPSALHSFLLD